MKPVRLQRTRKKGAKLVSPNGLPNVYVGRGSVYGNPCTFENSGDVHPALRFACEVVPLWPKEMLYYLRGQNLACWCPLDQPCHGDILLELANA
jgi:hypothetical protein